MEELIAHLKEIKEDVDYENVTDLVDGGYLKSLDIIQIVNMIREEYDVMIPISELKPKNFNNAHDILALIERLQDE